MKSICRSGLLHGQRRTLVLCLALLSSALSGPIFAQQRINCPDGIHYYIDTKGLQIQYEGHSFSATLSGLGLFSSKISLDPKLLQKATEATLDWDLYIQGLAAGYNSCAITKEQYAEGLTENYPGLKTDATGLERIRQLVSQGSDADIHEMNRLLGSYYKRLSTLINASNNKIHLERIEALVDSNTEQIQDLQGRVDSNTEQIQDLQGRVANLEEDFKRFSPPTPLQIGDEIEIKAELASQTQEAEAAYSAGYQLMNAFRFKEAIPHFQNALEVLKLPDFYASLAFSLCEAGEPDQAETTARDGLEKAIANKNVRAQATLSRALTYILWKRGDLVGAQQYNAKALDLDTSADGPESTSVAIDFNEAAENLKAQGNKEDLESVTEYLQQALNILEKQSPPDGEMLSLVYNNLGQALKDKGDFASAFLYLEKALTIGQAVHGKYAPSVAVALNNLGDVLRLEGNRNGAYDYFQESLDVRSRIYGPDNPSVAIMLNEIGQLLFDEKQLEKAKDYTQRALDIAEKAYGPHHLKVALYEFNLGLILADKGWKHRDFETSIREIESAVSIDTDIFGPDHPTVTSMEYELAKILSEKGDLDGAIHYLNRILFVYQNKYGPESPQTRGIENTVAELETMKHKKKN